MFSRAAATPMPDRLPAGRACKFNLRTHWPKNHSGGGAALSSLARSTVGPWDRWKRFCQALAIAALFCQALANAGCATESRMDALIAGMGARHHAALETATTTEEP